MTQSLISAAKDLERRIDQSPPDVRLGLQPEFSRVLERLALAGERVSPRMKSLEASLVDEAIEARFDNMPV